MCCWKFHPIVHSPTPRVSAPVRADADSDFCVTVRLDGLTPATAYYYRLRIADELDRYQPLPYRTRTAPRGRAAFRAAFGSCARLQIDTEQPIFDVIRAIEPDLMFYLGDNVYADTPAPEAIADLYRRQREIERVKPVMRTTPSLAIWDDHDFAFNDSDRSNPIREQSLDVFKRYWPTLRSARRKRRASSSSMPMVASISFSWTGAITAIPQVRPMRRAKRCWAPNKSAG